MILHFLINTPYLFILILIESQCNFKVCFLEREKKGKKEKDKESQIQSNIFIGKHDYVKKNLHDQVKKNLLLHNAYLL